MSSSLEVDFGCNRRDTRLASHMLGHITCPSSSGMTASPPVQHSAFNSGLGVRADGRRGTARSEWQPVGALARVLGPEIRTGTTQGQAESQLTAGELPRLSHMNVVDKIDECRSRIASS